MRLGHLAPDETRRAWRQVAVTASTAAIVIGAGKLWLMPALTRYLAAPDPAVAAQHVTRFTEAFSALLLLAALGLGIYAGRILRSGQVPPPGTRGLGRAPRTGREARAAGVILALTAAGLVALAVFALKIPGRTLAARASARQSR